MGKFIYYFLQWTWGIIMNILGFITFVFAKIAGWKVDRFMTAVRITAPVRFGGLEMGMFFVVGKGNECLSKHEFGHSIQNLWWGPLFPFVIAIPSAIRYWYRRIIRKVKPEKELPDYDAIWFEGQATRLGTEQFEKHEANK